MSRKIDVSVIVPLYNERESLVELHRQLCDSLDAAKLLYELIFVDDGSSDGSFEQLEKIKNISKAKITLIRLRKNMGKSTALAVGFQQVTADSIVTIDADLQDDPYEIPKLVRKIKQGYDLVCGWRTDRHDARMKRFLSKLFNIALSKVTGIKLHDFNTGLKAFTREVCNEIHIYGELHRFIPVLAVSRGFRVTEVPVKHHKRKHGSSKFGTRRIFKAAFDFIVTIFLISFKQQPMQLFGLAGSIFALI